jgi:hypothetical protein
LATSTLSAILLGLTALGAALLITALATLTATLTALTTLTTLLACGWVLRDRHDQIA